MESPFDRKDRTNITDGDRGRKKRRDAVVHRATLLNIPCPDIFKKDFHNLTFDEQRSFSNELIRMETLCTEKERRDHIPLQQTSYPTDNIKRTLEALQTLVESRPRNRADE